MATLTTRALLLGVVSLFEPANGYQLRRELLSWGVEDWAHIKPGSIYSMLTTFAKQGFIERYDVSDGDRTWVSYSDSTETRSRNTAFTASCQHQSDNGKYDRGRKSAFSTSAG